MKPAGISTIMFQSENWLIRFGVKRLLVYDTLIRKYAKNYLLIHAVSFSNFLYLSSGKLLQANVFFFEMHYEVHFYADISSSEDGFQDFLFRAPVWCT